LPSVNLGLGYQRAHTNEESLEISKLETMAKVALEIVRS
jgi:di/tripeptidase